MPTPIEVGFEANGEQSVKRAWEIIAKGTEDAIRSLAKMAPESNKADQAQRALGASAEKWLKAISTPMQDYLGDMEELKALLAAGKLNQEQFTLAADKAAQKLRDQTTEVDHLAARAEKLKSALITPQQKYQQELAEATELLKAQKITQEEYAAAVNRAKTSLDAQDSALQKNLADAARIKQAAVTPQQQYAEALKNADALLKKGLITQQEYAVAVRNAKQELDSQDQSLQATLRHADQIKQRAVTPEQAHAAAIASAKNALEKKLITQKQYDAELRHQNNLLAEAQQAQNEFTSSGTSGLTAMAGQLTIVGAAVQAIRSEYQNLIEAQKTAADKQTDTAAAQRQAVFALGKDPTLSVDEMVASANEASQKYGVPIKQVYEGYANAFSSKGQLTAKEAKSSADIAMQTMPHQGSVEIGGSLIGMKRQFGGKDEELIGMNIAGQQVSRVKDAAAYATNVVPTIVGLGKYENTAREATALPTAMSVAMEDLTGKQSATAVEKMAAQLKLAHEKFRTGLTSTTKQIEYLWTDQGDAMRKYLLGDGKGKKGKMEFESGALIQGHELLSKGDNKTKEAYKAALRDIPELSNADDYYANAMKEVNQLQIQKTSELDRKHKALGEQTSLHNVTGGHAAIARENLDKTLQGSGDWFLSRWMTARQMDVNEITGMETPEDFSIRTLKSRSQKLKTPVNVTSWGKAHQINPDERALADAEAIDKQVAYLESLKQRANPADAGKVAPDLAVLNPAGGQRQGEAKPAGNDQLVPLLKEIAKNTAKPPPAVAVVPKRVVNEPTKPRPSAALAAPGGR